MARNLTFDFSEKHFLPTAAACESFPHMMYLLDPRVIVLVITFVNRLHAVSPTVKLTSVSLSGCVLSQSGVQQCSVWYRRLRPVAWYLIWSMQTPFSL